LVLGVAYAVYRVANYAAPLASHKSAPKLALDGLKLRLPIIGKVTRGLAASKFCRALGALYGAGVGPGESVRLAADACGNAVMAKGALEIIPRLESGQRLTDSLASTGHFPTMALQMMQVGEESGSLDTQLDKTADFLESDAEVAIKQAVQALGILIFIAIAIRIGIQVGQFYLGYFNAIFEMADAV
jgi:type IV pilus assembly protein PilC